MAKIDLQVIKQILMDDCDYWLFAKHDYVNRFGNNHRLEDQIIFASLPESIPRGLKYDDITLRHIELFDNVLIDCNIFLNTNYAPFQRYVQLNDVWKAIPIKIAPKKFVAECLLRKTDGDIFVYEQIYKEVCDSVNAEKQSLQP